MAEESIKQTGKSEIIPTGELSCLLVFSEQKHVDYIYPLLSILEAVLKSKDYNPKRLGDDIRSGEDYMAKLQEMAGESVLGVVVFDGFRPNVLFEFGFLKGLGKPVILIQDKNATINVRTFYKNCREAGLSENVFDTKLKNPCINLPEHFSDFAGKHIAYVNWKTRETDNLHPSQVLQRELEKNQHAITEEIKRVKTKGFALAPAEMEKVLPYVVEIVELYTSNKGFSLEQLKSVYDGLLRISQENGFQIPPDLYSMVAASYVKLSENLAWNAVDGKVASLRSAVKVYEEIVNVIGFAGDKARLAETKRAIGDVYYDLAELRDKPDNLTKAIASYLQALQVYSFKTYPDALAVTQNNLGNAYGMLAEVKDKAANCKMAIQAYQHALRVYTQGQFPMDYAMTENNLGIAYRILAEVKNKATNCKMAIQAYQHALKIYTLEQFPVDYAMTQNNLGTAYRTLAEVGDNANNCKKAIQACQQALKIYTLDEYPMDYAMTQNNLGIAYETLADVKNKTANCKKAIRACQQALKVYTLDQFPIDYARTQNNLGNCYRGLAWVKNKSSNCKKAQAAYIESLKVYTKEEFPDPYCLVIRNFDRLRAFCKDLH
jgi:tetratricopeptide (TPR) repeat protein